jgi:hypothetical protein
LVYIYMMAPEPISTAHFVHPSRHSVYLCVYPTIVARQRHGKEYTRGNVVGWGTMLQARRSRAPFQM